MQVRAVFLLVLCLSLWHSGYCADFLYSVGELPEDKPLLEQLCRPERLKVLRVYNVGDSQSDAGNFHTYSSYLLRELEEVPEHLWDSYPWSVYLRYTRLLGLKLKVLPGSKYWQGHFTDGKVASELLVEALKLDSSNSSQFVNLAHGASTSIGYADYLLRVLFSSQSEAPELANAWNIMNSVLNGK